MTAITPEMTAMAYAQAKEVYAARKSRQDAMCYTNRKTGMTEGSVSMAIYIFKQMMNGDRYTRSMKPVDLEYFLSHILQDYGWGKLENALKSTIAHVDYYVQFKQDNLVDTRAIIKKYKTAIEEQRK